jgi:DNA-directed RNA polymerase II subunit RPB1
MTRLLTSKEIENMLDFIQPQEHIPLATALSVVNLHKERFRSQLSTQKIYPAIIPMLSKDIKKSYYESLIQAGESIGVVCAQSIGEKQTQTTLNTFHRAGQSEKTMTAGVPRFQELLNATKKPNIVNHKIYFNKGVDTIKNIRNTVGHTIVGLNFIDISLDIQIKLNKEHELWYPAYKILYTDKWECYSHCISIKINMAKLFEFKLTMEDIAIYIHNEFDDLCCVFSPEQYGQFDVWVDTTSIDLPSERILFIDTDNAIEIYLEECVQPILEGINICGINGISEVFYIQTQDSNEWFVETNGINSRTINTQYINYKNLLALDHVDYKRTISNNVWDIYEVLGIEAVRTFLVEEFMSIMEGINSCHAELLVDRMTHAGSIASITRYTMKKDESGPFGRASFEETMDNFLNAAARGEIEPTKGVSAAIICGKRASIGTGMIDLKIDINNLPE